MKILKRVGLVLLALLAIGGVVFALGPKVTVDEAAMLPVRPPPSDPAALDRYIAEREAAFDDITPGAEKTIIWADPANRARTPLSVVYLHGFGATRQELSPVPEEIAKTLGANLFLTRLRGHGRPGHALGQSTPAQWFEDTIEALAIGERIGERVILVGCSTGGTLAVWLQHWLGRGKRHPPIQGPPAALVLIAPNFGAADPRAGIMTLPWGVQIARMLVGDTYSWEPANPEQAKYWTHRHPPKALATVQAVVEHLDDQPPARPDVPTLVIWTAHDPVVDPARIQAWVDALPERRTARIFTDDIERGNHVMAGRIMAPARTAPVVSAVVDFVREL